MPMSQDLATKIINLLNSNSPVAAYASANRFLALHHVDPTKSCSVGELSGDNYARVQISPAIIQLAKGKGLTNEEVIVFPVASGTKIQQVLYGSVWDSINGGSALSYAALSAPANWTSGQSLSLAINAFITLVRDTI
jgi:hypothetical protein